MLEQPDARPIAGGKYRLHGDYTYKRHPWWITIPSGFTWDGASVPRFLWSLSGIRPDGLQRAAALVHDALYRWSGRVLQYIDDPDPFIFTRKEADVLFRDMIREAGGSWWTAAKAYRAVRMFGWMAWKS